MQYAATFTRYVTVSSDLTMYHKANPVAGEVGVGSAADPLM